MRRAAPILRPFWVHDAPKRQRVAARKTAADGPPSRRNLHFSTRHKVCLKEKRREILSTKGGHKMPGRDGTGPWGTGPRTGRGMGWCAAPPGTAPRAYPAGFGFGRGRRGLGMRCAWGPWAGFGPAWGRGAWGPLSREEEIGWLKAYASNLEQALDQARRRMAALAQEPSPPPAE